MAKQYIAIGIDKAGDVLATEIASGSKVGAITELESRFDDVAVHHVLEFDVAERKPMTPVVTKLSIG